jgi:serine/threonine-protein kinase
MERESLGRLQELFAGRFRIDRELGRGGFATVYQVWNPRLERAEALKVLAPGHEADDDFSRRFTQEVRLAAGLEHPSIVKVYDFGQAGTTWWYSMQLVGGRTLKGELRARGPLPQREVARIAIPLLEALEYSHARGIVHRDIKPENVILDHDGRPFLMDFGIAKSAASLVKTQAGLLVGTPAYVAPEQAQGKPIDGRADLYALGVTLYRTVTGRYPFEAEDPVQAVVLRLTEQPRPLARVLPGADPAFAAIVMRALEREPSSRWESARAMREALAAYLEGRPVDTGATRSLTLDDLDVEPVGEADELRPDATVLGAMVAPTVVRPSPTAPSPGTSAPGARSKRSALSPAAAAAAVLLFMLGTAGLVVLRSSRKTPDGPPPRHPGARAATTGATRAPVPPPTATVVAVAPATAPAATAVPLKIVLPAPTRPPEPPPRHAVTAPERLEPDPPFAGSPPAGCSGATVVVGFSIDTEGTVAAPRLFPTGAAPECGRYVLEALPRWKWRPAVDEEGVPVASARLVVSIQLP